MSVKKTVANYKTGNNLLVIVTSIVVVVIFAFSLVYYYNHTIINDGELTDINSEKYIYQVETVELTENEIKLSGWCFDNNAKMNEPDDLKTMRILLVNTDNYSEVIYFKADNGIERTDVDQYYLGESDYLYCGFEVDIDTKKLDLENKDYEIVIQPNFKESITLRPGVFVHDGSVMFSDPSIFVPLETDGTDLDNIVENGILHVYRPELGIYVYQFEGRLYYIADANYPLDNGWTNLGLNVFTNHSELLPVDRQEYGFEALGFVFSDYEITDSINAGKYRVAVYTLPSAYPITYINTGYSESLAGWDLAK